MVLKNLSFKIKAGEKIGIVGRTGAGKTSILSAILRIVELDANSGGDIIIGRMNIKKVRLDQLRRSISVIPVKNINFSYIISNFVLNNNLNFKFNSKMPPCLLDRYDLT